MRESYLHLRLFQQPKLLEMRAKMLSIVQPLCPRWRSSEALESRRLGYGSWLLIERNIP